MSRPRHEMSGHMSRVSESRDTCVTRQANVILIQIIISSSRITRAWLLIGCDRAVEYKCDNVLSYLRCSPSLATQEKRSGGSWPGQRWRAVLRCQEKNVDHYGDGDYMWPLLAFLHHTPGHGVQRSSDLEMKLRSTLSIIRHT